MQESRHESLHVREKRESCNTLDSMLLRRTKFHHFSFLTFNVVIRKIITGILQYQQVSKRLTVLPFSSLSTPFSTPVSAATLVGRAKVRIPLHDIQDRMKNGQWLALLSFKHSSTRKMRQSRNIPCLSWNHDLGSQSRGQ